MAAACGACRSTDVRNLPRFRIRRIASRTRPIAAAGHRDLLRVSALRTACPPMADPTKRAGKARIQPARDRCSVATGRRSVPGCGPAIRRATPPIPGPARSAVRSRTPTSALPVGSMNRTPPPSTAGSAKAGGNGLIAGIASTGSSSASMPCVGHIPLPVRTSEQIKFRQCVLLRLRSSRQRIDPAPHRLLHPPMITDTDPACQLTNEQDRACCRGIRGTWFLCSSTGKAADDQAVELAGDAALDFTATASPAFVDDRDKWAHIGRAIWHTQCNL